MYLRVLLLVCALALAMGFGTLPARAITVSVFSKYPVWRISVWFLMDFIDVEQMDDYHDSDR